MRLLLAKHSTPVVAVGVLLLTAAVAALDLVTGAELRVPTLYLLPLALAGWRLGRRVALGVALLATLAWLATLHTNGVQMSQPWLWAANGVTAGMGFGLVAWLVASLQVALSRERSLSRSDPLTGLANRRAFVDQAGRALALARRQAYPVSLACLDLDNFKAANDRFGHARGDSLLQRCAVLLNANLRQSDTVGRMGGDEFAIFVPTADASHAQALVERVCQAIDTDPAFMDAGVTSSIGLVCEAPAASDLDALLNQADARMYERKRARKAGDGGAR